MFSIKLPKIQKTILLIYTIGAIGICIPLTRQLFIFLTPAALLFSAGLLFYEKYCIEKSKFTIQFYIYAGFVYIFTLTIEIIGVNTGWPFGNYSYLSALGIKIFGTPLLIGLNWFLMVYCSAVLFNFVRNIILKTVLSALSMVIFDIVMEQVSCFTQMWCWQFHIIPLKNYIAWFIIALILHTIAALFKIRFSSHIASLIFISQFFYFVVIYLFLKLLVQ